MNKTILVLNWRDPWHPLAGGAEIMLQKHIEYWQKKGLNILWFTSMYPHAETDEIKNGIHFIRKGSQYSVHFAFFIAYGGHNIPHFDVVIDCFHFIPFFTPLFIKRKKIIAHIHEVAGDLWFENISFPIACIGKFIEPYFFHLYNKIPFITGAKSTKDELIQLHILHKNIYIIPHGLSLPEIHKQFKKTTEPSCLYLGRVSKDKGIEDVIQAFTIIKKQIPAVELFIAGKEENKDLLKNIFVKYSLTDLTKIHIYGFVSEERKFELLQKALILLHASKKEGWGLTVIEAASQSTPTVGYNVEGLRDSIIDEETGILVAPNPDAMAKSTITLLLDKKRLYSLGKQAKQYSQQFNWEKSGTLSYNLIHKHL